ncbi:uncharacterized protein K452DRAFT_322546 [Aplosporella prunicola CBS 121167]|uniref:Helicase ATP-binding domain-containing protein n=1 Tax=Aplosporella prunicola CBS 121167 TaxID=1176127 RepID=A0A6A6AX89_9PEZI|nr:uncharacterized protein K452DRAFT_322546 [Aplosporella prunicola CBS 121167]KAF2136226.1 hypothetical protein K452DRAFT_322546 [Aplosporella prunicola CBS 121167]
MSVAPQKRTKKDPRRGVFRPINNLSSQQTPSRSARNKAPAPAKQAYISTYFSVAEATPAESLLQQSDAEQKPRRSSLPFEEAPEESSVNLSGLGNSTSLFLEDHTKEPRLSISPAAPIATLVPHPQLPRHVKEQLIDGLYIANNTGEDSILHGGNHTQHSKMVNEREPPRPVGQQHFQQPSAPKFGEASPLRNPLKKDQYSHMFNKPRSGLSRPEFHKANTHGFVQQRPESGAVPIQKPTAPATYTIPPTPQPVFSSVQRPVGGFQPINGHQKPNPIDFSGEKKNRVVDLTGSDDEFDADAAIRDDRFGAADPFAYVESNQANDNIKALLEGAFDDEDDKPKTRLRKKKKQQQQEKKDEAALGSLADKLKALEVKAEDKAEEAPEPEPEEEEEEEDDGTVEGLNVKLLPHQVDGVAWMTDKEVGQRKKNGVLPKGGILADDMGLGKTVQSLALILNNPRPDPKEEAEKDAKKNKNIIPPSVSKCTLVVAPLALIKQWESEVKTKVLPSHSLKVLVHHGPSRTKSAETLKKYDIVITTYQILASEHAASSDAAGGPRIGCFGVHWYRIMLDEAHSIKNRNAKMSQAACALRSHYRWCLTGTPMQNNLDELQSLIKFLRIKPYDELIRWKTDIAAPMKNGRGNLAMRRLQVFLKAFMKRRTKDVLKKEGALNPGGKPDKNGKKSEGFRIVGRKVETVVAEFDPQERRFYDRLADRAQNRLKELMGGEKADYIGALVLLLRLRQACNHPELVGGQVGKDKDALAGAGSAPAAANGPGTPRKTKTEESKELDDLADLLGGLGVAAKHCDVCQIELSKDETASGAVRCADCESDLAAQKKKHKKKKHHKSKDNRQSNSEAQEEKDDEEDAPPRKPKLLRKKPVILDSDDEEEEADGSWLVPENERQVEDLGKAGGTDDENAEGGGEWLNSEDDDETEDDGPESPSILRSQRRDNVINLVSSEAEQATEKSESEDEEEEDGSEESDSDDSLHEKNTLHTSTKIRRLLEILEQETLDHKIIVFSQFTSMLDLIEPFLRKAAFGFTRYDGSMRNDHREASLNKLRNDVSCRILLCSLKCGSLGLNLTAASRVVILEPFWNPFVEEQAIDRVHRLNQTVDVVVYKLTVAHTVEERILDLQEAKRKLANAAIEGGKAMGKLSMKDIMNLFRRDAEFDAGVAGPPGGPEEVGFAKVLQGNRGGRGGKGLIGQAVLGVGEYAQEGMADLEGREAAVRVPAQRKGVGRQDHAVYGRR